MNFNGLSKSKLLSPIDLAGLGVAGVLTVAFLLCVIGPLALRKQSAAAQQQATILQTQRANSAAAEIRTLTRQISDARRDLQNSTLRAQPPGTVNARLAQLIALATADRLNVQTVQPSSPQSVNRFSVISIHVAGRGKYSACSNFLHQIIERMPDVGVHGFSVRATPDFADAQFEVDLTWLAASTTGNNETAVATVETP